MAILRRWPRLAGWPVIGIAIAGSITHAGPQSLEAEVKAAYIYNFVTFAEWPPTAFASSADPLRVCSVGDPRFELVLERSLRGETINGRRVVLDRSPGPDAWRRCHAIFIAEGGATEAVLQATSDVPVLTVGESELFARRGGLVTFVVDAGRVRFDVNQTAAEKRGLKLSSRLLRLARRVM